MEWPTEESSAFPTIKQPVIVREGDDHNRADNNLAVHNNWFVVYFMHTCLKTVISYLTGYARTEAPGSRSS